MPRAFITGITGQDGSYLAELLLAKGYEVAGLVRRSRSEGAERIGHIVDDLTLHTGDLLDEGSLMAALLASEPDEVYNLASQSEVRRSFAQPVLTADVNALGTTRLLDAVNKVAPSTRFFQASTSEIFGNPSESPQHELTRLQPRNPYGVAKVYAHLIAVNYRDSHGMHVSNGILFNHESPRRSVDFVTRKISHGVARILKGEASELHLGDLETRRDWGYAGDVVEAMWLMLRQDEPGDFVIATGQTHSIRDFVELAFSHVGLDYTHYVKHDEAQVRPSETSQLVGDPSKAKSVLGWTPKVTFEQLVTDMVDADVRRLERGDASL